MQTDLELGVAEMFRDAVKQNIVMDLRTDADWSRFNAIKETADQSTDEANRALEQDRPERLATARKDIINQAGALDHVHPTPFGTDGFDRSAIDRQATTKVENDHQRDLLGIKQDEGDAYVALRDEIHLREGIQDQARDAFTRSTDRRDGGERRVPSQSR